MLSSGFKMRSIRSLVTKGSGAVRRLAAVGGTGNPKSGGKALSVNDEILHVVQALKTEHRPRDNGCLELKECNLCSKPNKDKPDNIWKLNIRPDGSYYCYRCSIGGSFQDLRRKANVAISTGIPTHSGGNGNGKELLSEFNDAIETKTKKTMYPHQNLTNQFHLNLFPASGSASVKDKTERAVAKAYLNETRGLKDEILQKYQVGYTVQEFLSSDGESWDSHVCVTFPTIEAASAIDTKDMSFVAAATSSPKAKKPITINDKDFFIQRVKYRAITTKGLQRLLPKGGAWGFFGWHTASVSTSSAIIITEGEYDCMAVAQALESIPSTSDAARRKLKDVPVVSLPNGCSSFPSDLIPLLEKKTHIYLYMDYDQPGQQGAEKMVRKLGPGRCYIVRPSADVVNPPKDANDALRREGGEELIVRMLTKATQLSHQHIETFATMRPAILQYINSLNNPDAALKGIEGTITPSLPALTEVTKGFRRGELVVLSGPTGCGKTTVLSQLSLDFARQGALTLWGSFEVKNNRLVLKMLQQSYKKSEDVVKLSSVDLERVLDDFEALPLQFMNFYGATGIDTIMEAMEYTVDKDDVQHVIIDNLQFLMPRIGAKSAFEKFDYQDLIIERFRKFCTEKNVNIILVVHPRKQEDEALLGLSSIGGSAKASQEADVVLLLQKSGGEMYLDVRKNRYDGQLGRIGLHFDTLHCTYSQTTVDMNATNFTQVGPYTSYNNYLPMSSQPQMGSMAKKFQRR